MELASFKFKYLIWEVDYYEILENWRMSSGICFIDR